MVSVWHQSTARAKREQVVPMLSNEFDVIHWPFYAAQLKFKAPIVFQKKESTIGHENESFLKQIFSCFKVLLKWNISIFILAHLLCAHLEPELPLPQT